MTSSTSTKMDRYTTTEYGKQNMFAHEPQIQVDTDHDYWKKIAKYFKKSDTKVPSINKNQAIIPTEGEIIPNPIGSARGFKLTYYKSNLVILPGVPLEMKSMMLNSIIPYIKPLINEKKITVKLKTVGISESVLATKITENISEDFSRLIGYYPHPTE